jgi:hypothetical protein
VGQICCNFSYGFSIRWNLRFVKQWQMSIVRWRVWISWHYHRVCKLMNHTFSMIIWEISSWRHQKWIPSQLRKPQISVEQKTFSNVNFLTIVCLTYLPRPSCPTYFLKVCRLFFWMKILHEPREKPHVCISVCRWYIYT